jgi:hypothetical protein
MPRIKGPIVRDPIGAAEAAEILGVSVSNLDRQAGLPKPKKTIRATRVWQRADIEAFAEKRRGS